MANLERLRLLKLNEENMKAFFTSLVHQLQGTILRYSDSNNVIPRPKWDRLRQELRSVVTQAFIGPAHQYSLYSISNGQIKTPSPFLNALWPAFSGMVSLGASEQRDILVKHLKKQPEIMQSFSHAAVKRPAIIRETEIKPQTEYDPLHLFVDPKGYNLSDHIWQTAVETRSKLDAMVADGIKLGRSARDLSADVEIYLTPGEALKRTGKPYGTDGSFSAMRLARTEVSSAHTLASHASALKNPFVQQYNVVLSPSHTVPDECDDEADGGPYDKNDTSHLPVFHPHCMCTIHWVTTEDTDSIVSQLQALLSGDGGEVDNVEVGPEEDLASAIADLFTGKILDWLLGG